MKMYKGSSLRFQFYSKYRTSLFMTIASFITVAVVLAVVGIAATIDTATPPITKEGIVQTLRINEGAK